MKYLLIMMSVLISISAMGANKFAIVDIQKVVFEVKQGKKAMAALKAEGQKKEKIMKAKEQNFMKQRKELEEMMKNPAVDRAKAEAKGKQLAQTYQMLQAEAQKLQKEFMKKQQIAGRKILEKAQIVLAKIVKKDNYTMVFNKAALMYAPPSIDITNQLIREYDKAYK